MYKTDRDLADEIRSAYLTDTHWSQNADRFIRSLLTTDEDDEMTCQECEAVLPEYLLAEREGSSNLVRWRTAVRHLGLCPHCTNDLREANELTTFGLGERGVEPPKAPGPDLSFLQSKRKEAVQPQPDFWHFDMMGHLIIRLAVPLFRPLAPLAPAYALRGQEDGGTLEAGSRSPLGRLSLGSPVLDDLQVDVAVQPNTDDPALCLVVVRVEIPSRWPELAGSEVTLVAGDSMFSEVTDESGEATFRKVSRAALDSTTLSVQVSR